MTFQLSTLVNYVYCIVTRSRLTDVARMAIIECESLNSGETKIVYCIEAVRNGCTKCHQMIRATTKIRGRNLNNLYQKYCREHLEDPDVKGG